MSRSTEPRRARRRAPALVAALLFGLLPALVAAPPAVAAGMITATILDTSASPVEGLDVVLTNLATGQEHPLTTSATGVVELPFTDDAEYVLESSPVDADVNGDHYVSAWVSFDTAVTTSPGLTVSRAGLLTGTIPGWDAATMVSACRRASSKHRSHHRP